MKHILLFFIILFLFSCGEQIEQESIAQEKSVAAFASNKYDLMQEGEDTTPVKHILDSSAWAKYQDSLRNVILNHKESEVLKKSFLQELYIRNVVNVLNDSLYFHIPFDLHGCDCIAPDCYETDVSFSFKLGDTLIFPKKVHFREHEYGCVDKETNISGLFELKELNNDLIIYHSDQYKRTLVFYKREQRKYADALYFTNVGLNTISGNNFFKLMGSFNGEDNNSICPFSSGVLITGEYELFLK